MKTLIFGGQIVNEGATRVASIVVDGDTITDIIEGTDTPRGSYDQIVDATGCFVLPGVIDDHVHFRDPGLTQKADIATESRAAAYGGVTSYFDMPNTKPQTTTLAALDDKYAAAARKSHVNYGFFIGATNDNIDTVCSVDPHRVPGIKLFMGSSTGNMLVDRRDVLRQLFAKSPLPIMAHCEDTDIINRNMAEAKRKYGEDPAVEHHPEIRSEEACWESTRLAVELATEAGARLHVAHLTTERELTLFGHDPRITAEAVIAHLFFCDADYARLGTRIKCNPAIKTRRDRDALRRALADGRIATVGTDHAPHLLADKEGGCARAASGMPMVQFSLVAMLELVDEGALTIERLVELMCHNPARLFEVNRRGFLRPGFKADVVVVRPGSPWTVTTDCIQSKCKWSPMEGHTFNWQVRTTMCNGQVIYNNGAFDGSSRGQALEFRMWHGRGGDMIRRIDYNISQLRPYINWLYFFHAWGLSGKPQEQKDRLRHEACAMLDLFERRYRTHAVLGIFQANSDGDDLLLGGTRIPMLRQQHPAGKGEPNLCLADFVRPLSSGIADAAGAFATTVDAAMEHDFGADDYKRMLSQTLADRLAEATAELMHLEARRTYWGYAPDEHLTIPELLHEDFQGIRPAVGYPSMPDTSVNFLIDQLIDMKQIGIRLTESGAMKPHASVSGLMFAHPRAKYFDIGKIGADQLADYARRRHIPLELARRFLASRLQ